uniref:Uncharacterized protein n=1 Tax=Panagrolaimus davidi TaxID=227884 RepID=A0A914QX30_9BILA
MDLFSCILDDIPVIGQVKAVYDYANGDKNAGRKVSQTAAFAGAAAGKAALTRPEFRQHAASVSGVASGINSMASSSSRPHNSFNRPDRFAKKSEMCSERSDGFPRRTGMCNSSPKPNSKPKQDVTTASTLQNCAYNFFAAAINSLSDHCPHQCDRCKRISKDKECFHQCKECQQKK